MFRNDRKSQKPIRHQTKELAVYSFYLTYSLYRLYTIAGSVQTEDVRLNCHMDLWKSSFPEQNLKAIVPNAILRSQLLANLRNTPAKFLQTSVSNPRRLCR